jgi:FixJ family two-component response regulator
MTEQRPVVFIIDDDASVRDGVSDLLHSIGIRVESFGAVQEFLQSKRADAPGCIVLDVRLPGTSGLEFQRTLAESGIQLPVIFISGYGDISMSVRAMKSGAMEFLTKPCATRNCSTPSKRGSSAIEPGANKSNLLPNCRSASRR